ncbi:MAG: DUF1343 domain-containing protein [Pirellulales bacterium]
MFQESCEVVYGLETFCENPERFIKPSQRIGLLLNQASVDSNLRLAADVIAESCPGQLRCLFSPQHGIWGEQQANMLESPHGTYSKLNIPVFSLYSQTRKPDPEMLEDIDCLIVDLQDVGTRVYTFIWTLLEVLRACAEHGKSVIVLDRPNPLGGQVIEGPLLDINFISFVGGWTIPMRHALTMGEIAMLLVAELAIDVELSVVPMQGWRRSFYFDQLNRHWMWPSPNMPAFTTTLLYPGQVLLEGVNLSEGRGTTRPFEVIGAPFVDSALWLRLLSEFDMPGIKLLPTRFQPTFDKWKQEGCLGLDIRIIDRNQARSFSMTIAMLATAAKLFSQFAWLPPPYEYEYIKPPIDILYGNSELRETIELYRRGECERSVVEQLAVGHEELWRQRTEDCLIYN